MSVSISGVSMLSTTNEPEVIEPGENTQLGKDAFLKLLVAQMQNQDPLNPQSNEEFIAQLSQFTQVEQLMELSDGFNAMYMAMNSVNNTSMTQLLGKQVVALGDQFYYDGEGSIDLHYNSAAASSGSKLTIYDENGSIVYSASAGALVEGEGKTSWDGLNLDGRQLGSGEYRFVLEGFDNTGEKIAVDELVVGVVDGMSFLGGVPSPSINDVEFLLSDVLRVETSKDSD